MPVIGREVTPQQRIAELEREVRVYRDGLLDIIRIARREGRAVVPEKAKERAQKALDDGPRA
jgi:hypothetical protein